MDAEAEEHFRVAEAIYSSMGNARCEAAALYRLGVFYFSQGRDQEAKKCIAQAHIAYPDFADRTGLVKLLEEMSEARPLIDKVFNSAWSHFFQLSKSGGAKRGRIEAGQIHPGMDVQDTEGQDQCKAVSA